MIVNSALIAMFPKSLSKLVAETLSNYAEMLTIIFSSKAVEKPSAKSSRSSTLSWIGTSLTLTLPDSLKYAASKESTATFPM